MNNLITMKSKYDIMNTIATDVLQKLNAIENNKDQIKENTKNIVNNEKYIRDQDIYSRRNNIEFCNIPENVHQNQLEEYIIRMLNKVNIKVSSHDIVAVHRLGKF